MGNTITKVDAIGVPSRDWQRSRKFYVETVGLRPDEHSPAEFWVDNTCFAIWEPERFGAEFRNELVLHRRYAPYKS